MSKVANYGFIILTYWKKYNSRWKSWCINCSEDIILDRLDTELKVSVFEFGFTWEIWWGGPQGESNL